MLFIIHPNSSSAEATTDVLVQVARQDDQISFVFTLSFLYMSFGVNRTIASISAATGDA
jgi:hypothetical protein